MGVGVTDVYNIIQLYDIIYIIYSIIQLYDIIYIILKGITCRESRTGEILRVERAGREEEGRACVL